MATHFSVLAWKIPGMGEPGGLPSMGPHRVGHDCSDLAAAGLDIQLEKSITWRLQHIKGTATIQTCHLINYIWVRRENTALHHVTSIVAYGQYDMQQIKS